MFLSVERACRLRPRPRDRDDVRRGELPRHRRGRAGAALVLPPPHPPRAARPAACHVARARADGPSAADRVDRLAALQAIPPLIKAYLRLGGFVGEGAFIDRTFNTTDVCLVMDTARMNAQGARPLRARAGPVSRPGLTSRAARGPLRRGDGCASLAVARCWERSSSAGLSSFSSSGWSSGRSSAWRRPLDALDHARRLPHRLRRHGHAPRRRGAQMRRRAASWRTIRLLARHLRAQCAEARLFRLEGRGRGLARHRLARARHRHRLHQPHRARGPAQTEIFEANGCKAGHRLLFFPEGTSTDGRRVLPFKTTLFGAFFAHARRTPCAIQPVSVIYIAPAGEDARFYGWWGEMDFGPHLLKVLACSGPGR
jgi:hypothetical protein